MPNTIRILSSPLDDQQYLYTPYYTYAHEGHFWIEWRFYTFMRVIKLLNIPLDSELIGLDIGCGNGVVRRQIERHSRWIVDGADLTRGALHLNHTTLGQNLVYNISERRSEFHEKYDILILFDILEHIKHTQQFLESALYHLKSGGWICVNVPALSWLFSPYDRVQGHFRRYTSTMLRQEFQHQNLHTQRIHYWGGLLLPLVFLRKILVYNATSPEVVFRKGFQIKYTWLNTLLLGIMRIEMSICKSPVLGSSLFAVARKT